MRRKRRADSTEEMPTISSHSAATLFAVSPAPVFQPPSSARLKLAAAGVLCWSLALIVLAVFSSNLPIVSADQLCKSDAVVIGQRLDNAVDRIRIVRVLVGDVAVDDELFVPNLPAVADVLPQTRYICPLKRVRGEYAITTLDGQQTSPLVYPATPALLAQSQRILGERGN